MAIERRASGSREQSPTGILEIRKKLAEIYEHEEVKEAIVNTFLGKVDDYSRERFRRDHEVVVKRNDFAFHLFPRDHENLGPNFAILKLFRHTLNNLSKEYSSAPSFLVDATSPHRISVVEFINSIQLDPNAPDRIYHCGEDAIQKAREVVASYNQQVPPVSN